MMVREYHKDKLGNQSEHSPMNGEFSIDSIAILLNISILEQNLAYDPSFQV